MLIKEMKGKLGGDFIQHLPVHIKITKMRKPQHIFTGFMD